MGMQCKLVCAWSCAVGPKTRGRDVFSASSSNILLQSVKFLCSVHIRSLYVPIRVIWMDSANKIMHKKPSNLLELYP